MTLIMTLKSSIKKIRNNLYLVKVNKRNTIKKCEQCSKLTIKTAERRQWRIEHISPFSSVYFVGLKRELGRDCLNNFFVNTVDKLASQNL